MKQFFKMMFASALGVFVAIGIFFFVSIFMLIGMVGSMGGSSVYTPKENTVFRIHLDGSITDVAKENPFAALTGEKSKAISLSSLLSAIEKAKNNDNVKGIYLDAASLSAGTADLQAIRRALIDFKESGKFIVAYADFYTQGAYYVCSVADKVFTNPEGGVNLVGLASRSMFFKGLMDKVGIEMEIFKVGTYKGAVEPFMLNKLSDANREQIESYVTSIWNNIAQGIAESRGIQVSDVNHFADEALAMGATYKVVECGLVDELKFRSEVESYLKELVGQDEEDDFKYADLSDIKNIKTLEKKHEDKIAVIYAEGDIAQESSSLYSSAPVISEKLAKELMKVAKDDEVKAVVLRVNSPGGSAYISEQIWHQVVELKKQKPLVVSMGSMAASGGYYISCAADKIVAEATTLTGSIGVFGTLPIYAKVMDKVGVTTDFVTSNRYADLGDTGRPMREDEKQIIQSSVERTYTLFLTRCADGRGKTIEEIDAVGQGRVWTGEQALERGLVDQLGGLDTAVEVAAELAELTEYSVTDVIGTKDKWTEIMEKALGEVKMSIVGDMLGADYEYFKTLEIIRHTSGIQARIPYDMQPL